MTEPSAPRTVIEHAEQKLGRSSRTFTKADWKEVATMASRLLDIIFDRVPLRVIQKSMAPKRKPGRPRVHPMPEPPPLPNTLRAYIAETERAGTSVGNPKRSKGRPPTAFGTYPPDVIYRIFRVILSPNLRNHAGARFKSKRSAMVFLIRELRLPASEPESKLRALRDYERKMRGNSKQN